MISETSDFKKVAKYLHMEMPNYLLPDVIPPQKLLVTQYDTLGLLMGGNEMPIIDGNPPCELQMLIIGEDDITGIILVYDDLVAFLGTKRVSVFASSERVVREFLLSLPSDQEFIFDTPCEWIYRSIKQFFDGKEQPGRIYFYADKQMLKKNNKYPARQLTEADHHLVGDVWAEGEWQQLTRAYYTFYGVILNDKLMSICASWKIPPYREEVNAFGVWVDDGWDKGYAESVLSQAAEDVLEHGNIATCSFIRADKVSHIRVLENIGFVPYFRSYEYLAYKKGSHKPFLSYSDLDKAIIRASKKAKSAKSEAFGGNIDSLKHPVIQFLRSLCHEKDRDKYDQFLLEGTFLLAQAISDGVPLSYVVYTPRFAIDDQNHPLLSALNSLNIPHYMIGDGLMAKIIPSEHRPSVVASAKKYMLNHQDFHISRQALLLFVDQIQDPGNLGTIIRTADAANVDGVLISSSKIDPYSRKSVRASMGSIFHVPIINVISEEESIQRFSSKGIQLVATSPHAVMNYYDIDFTIPTVILVGNETLGLSEELLLKSDIVIRIPMMGKVDSLNIAVATGILLYDAVRQRKTRVGV